MFTQLILCQIYVALSQPELRSDEEEAMTIMGMTDGEMKMSTLLMPIVTQCFL